MCVCVCCVYVCVHVRYTQKICYHAKFVLHELHLKFRRSLYAVEAKFIRSCEVVLTKSGRSSYEVWPIFLPSKDYHMLAYLQSWPEVHTKLPWTLYKVAPNFVRRLTKVPSESLPEIHTKLAWSLHEVGPKFAQSFVTKFASKWKHFLRLLYMCICACASVIHMPLFVCTYMSMSVRTVVSVSGQAWLVLPRLQGNVGDSRAIASVDGAIKELSSDHKPTKKGEWHKCKETQLTRLIETSFVPSFKLKLCKLSNWFSNLKNSST